MGEGYVMVRLAGSLVLSALVLGWACGEPARAQQPAASSAAEIEFWQSVKDAKHPGELKAYLEKYPSGDFAPLADADGPAREVCKAGRSCASRHSGLERDADLGRATSAGHCPARAAASPGHGPLAGRDDARRHPRGPAEAL